jgi:DNA modification methylase
MPEPLTTMIDKILCGDASRRLKEVPDQVIDTIVTSPPYYLQRDYKEGSQIGREQTPQEYIDRMVEVFAECHRTLKSSGSMWLVLGDKYMDGRLLGMPWRVALALGDAGWILRSDVIWHKPNAMPSSVKNRPTIDHEYLFFFTKSTEYFYDADAIREPHVTFTENSRMKGGRGHFFKRNGTPEEGKNQGSSNLHDSRWDQAFHPKGRNKRTVWSIPLSKFRDVHFAVFPVALVETCLLASSPEGGLVLDPFAGSGTTALVAKQLGRHYLGIDCNEDYCRMARARLREVLC